MAGTTSTATVTIPAPKFQTVVIDIKGDAPMVQHKFSAKIKTEMHEKQVAGSTAKKGAKRESKDFQALYKDAMHVSTEGWYGIPAPAFRNAMVSACRIVGFQMTKAKLAVFVKADGFDPDGTPLVRITKGEPEYHEAAVRLATGVVDLRARPMFREGWEASVSIKFDGDMFTQADIAHLMMRVGMQVGIGEGRPDSKASCGQGWGTFEVKEEDEAVA
jgi:hypothetical protein